MCGTSAVAGSQLTYMKMQTVEMEPCCDSEVERMLNSNYIL